MKKIKAIGLLLFVFALLISCTQQNNSNAKNEELVKKYVNAVQTNDAANMESLLADDYIGLGPSANDSINKPDAISNWKFNMENLYESIHYDKSRTIAVTVQMVRIKVNGFLIGLN